MGKAAQSPLFGPPPPLRILHYCQHKSLETIISDKKDRLRNSESNTPLLVFVFIYL